MEIWLHGFPVPRHAAALAVEAEKRGFDGLMLADSENLVGDPWVELALAARRHDTAAARGRGHQPGDPASRGDRVRCGHPADRVGRAGRGRRRPRRLGGAAAGHPARHDPATGTGRGRHPTVPGRRRGADVGRQRAHGVDRALPAGRGAGVGGGDEFLDRFTVVGPADHCAQRLRELADLGLDRIIIVPASRDADPELVAASNRRFADEVLPRLHG